MIKKTIQIIGIVSLLFISRVELNAQQHVQFTHYMYNNLSINPAYAGSHEALNVTGIYRTQWVGLEGSPNTANIYAHTPIGDALGVGFSFVNDKIGPISYSSPNLSLSYAIKLKNGLKLAFGASAKLNHYQGDLTILQATDGGDNFLATAPESTNELNFGAGTYIYSDNYYVGFSVPDLLTDRIDNLYPGTTNEILQKHYYVIAGAIFDIADGLKLKPSATYKFTNNAPSSFELSGQFLLKDKLWLGGMMRVKDAVGILVGYQFNDQLKAGYSYDFTTSNLQKVNSGSHELFISYDFVYRNKKITSPRYF